jgi:prepilin-type N-terminal cleavage/methylation domain-containing protein
MSLVRQERNGISLLPSRYDGVCMRGRNFLLAQAGFSLIELMVTVAIIGVLAATAIPAFIKYTRKAKTSEARQNIRKIYDGSRQYYLDQHVGAVTNMNAAPLQFLGGSTALTPAVSCCASGGKCEPEASQWETTAWRALQFSVPDPHYYRYLYTGPPIFTLMDFAVEVWGDLDCDGLPSNFLMYGFVDPAIADGPIGTGLIQRVDELE